MTTIKQWPTEQQPREKLLRLGSQALSNAELLAIFLRTGIQGMNVVELATDLLQRFGSLAALLNANQQQFCQHKGLGEAKFAQLQAVMEMARRTLAESCQRDQCMDSVTVAADFAAAHLAAEINEVFAIMLLDSQHRLIEFQRLFQGTIHQSAVYPRVIVQAALAANAAAVILCHNHPSGVAEPSEADIRITLRLQQALALIDVEVLDHLVVAQGLVVSLAQRGVI